MQSVHNGQCVKVGGREAVGQMVKGFNMKLDQIRRGEPGKKGGSREVLSSRTLT